MIYADAIGDVPPESALRYYVALEGASREMLEAARLGDWDTVCRLEGACAVVIARLHRINEQHPLSLSEQPERLRILRAIIANDAEIRRIAQPLPDFIDAHAGWGEVSLSLH
jgi:flagellar protein FliT